MSQRIGKPGEFFQDSLSRFESNGDLEDLFGIPGWKRNPRKLICGENIHQHQPETLGRLYARILKHPTSDEDWVTVFDGQDELTVIGDARLLMEFEVGTFVQIEGPIVMSPNSNDANAGLCLRAYEIEEVPDCSDESLVLLRGTALEATKWSSVIYAE